ncbi:unannotated protein [freshwater metagenome]|uniref:Unannotated protein n=1 Tax=freshwater metagenome TaxID=449393 RepID=A0A6J6C3T5_9ZZZZ
MYLSKGFVGGQATRPREIRPYSAGHLIREIFGFSWGKPFRFCRFLAQVSCWPLLFKHVLNAPH